MNQGKVTLSLIDESLVGFLLLPDEIGPFPSVIVCHGAGEYKENYVEMGSFLTKKGIAVLVMDLYGHGESSGVRHVVDIKRWVNDIRACCDYLCSRSEIDPNRICGFGLSSGGTAILECALIETRLRSLVVLDATVRNPLPFFKTIGLGIITGIGWIFRFFTGRELYIDLDHFVGNLPPAVDPEINRDLVERSSLKKNPKGSPFPGGTPSFFVNTIKRVPKLTQPTLVIWGEDDQIDPPETARLLFLALRCKKRLEIVAGNGHVGHLDQNRKKVFKLTASTLFMA